jgi:hypothetical protein
MGVRINILCLSIQTNRELKVFKKLFPVTHVEIMGFPLKLDNNFNFCCYNFVSAFQQIILCLDTGLLRTVFLVIY